MLDTPPPPRPVGERHTLSMEFQRYHDTDQGEDYWMARVQTGPLGYNDVFADTAEGIVKMYSWASERFGHGTAVILRVMFEGAQRKESPSD